MTTQTETATLENNQLEVENQNINADYSGNPEEMNGNFTSETGINGTIPMGQGMQYDTGASGAFQTQSEGLVMGVGGGVGDNARDVTFGTKNTDGTAYGTTKTTTTTTTTQYGLAPTSGTGLTTTSTQYQMGQGEGNGLIMGVGGGVLDDAADVTYSTKSGMNTVGQGLMGQTTTTTTTTYTQSGLGQTQGQIIQGDGSGLVMGVDNRVQDDAADVTYSSKTGQKIGTTTAKTTTTTTTTQYNLGQTQGQVIQGDGAGLIMGVGGGTLDDAVDVTYSTKTDKNLATAAAKTTTTTTTTETQYGIGSAVATGVRRSVDISKYATTQTINEGVDIKSLEIYNKTTLLQDKVQHIIKREIQPIVKTVIKPIIQKEIQPIVQREIQPIIQKEIQPIVQKEIQPIIQKEIQPIVKKEIQPIIQKEVQPIVKKEIQPILYREEQHITKKEIVPKVERQEQKQVKTKVVPYILREEKHSTSCSLYHERSPTC